jgi:hypothetical protein
MFMKKVVLTIIMFAIGIGLIVGVIIPIATHGRTTGGTANGRFDSSDTSISGLATPIP